MDQNQDMEMQEMMGELAEGLGRNRKKDENLGGGSISSGFMHQGRPMIIGAVCILILIAFFTIFFGTRNKVSKNDLNSIKVKLEQMEKRLTLLDGIVKKTAHLEDEIKGLQKSISNLDRSRSSLKGQQDKLAKRIDQLQNMKIPIGAKAEPPPTVQKRQDSQAKMRYHIVRRGETLFQIAKKYGISLNELLRHNNITKSKIYPGQKILVSSERHQ